MDELLKLTQEIQNYIDTIREDAEITKQMMQEEDSNPIAREMLVLAGAQITCANEIEEILNEYVYNENVRDAIQH